MMSCVTSTCPGEVSQKVIVKEPYDLHKGSKIAVHTQFGIASTYTTEDFLQPELDLSNGKLKPEISTEWMSHQPIRPKTPPLGPPPPPYGARCQYTLDLDDLLVRIHNPEQRFDTIERQAKSHSLPPVSNFPGPGGEKPDEGDGPKGGSTGPKTPESRLESTGTLDHPAAMKESLCLISRELIANRIKAADTLRAVDTINTRLNRFEQNTLHDLQLGQDIILAKLKALLKPFNDPDADYIPQPVPQHPFRQVEADVSIKDVSLNAAPFNDSASSEIVPVEMGPRGPEPGRPTIPPLGPKPDREPKPKPPRPWTQQEFYGYNVNIVNVASKESSCNAS